jgi:hypothetical protein
MHVLPVNVAISASWLRHPGIGQLKKSDNLNVPTTRARGGVAPTTTRGGQVGHPRIITLAGSYEGVVSCTYGVIS